MDYISAKFEEHEESTESSGSSEVQVSEFDSNDERYTEPLFTDDRLLKMPAITHISSKADVEIINIII